MDSRLKNNVSLKKYFLLSKKYHCKISSYLSVQIVQKVPQTFTYQISLVLIILLLYNISILDIHRIIQKYSFFIQYGFLYRIEPDITLYQSVISRFIY